MMTRVTKGFTLVEVMVALAVVAIALPALLFSLHQQIDGTAYMRDKSLAHMVATNRLAEVRLLAKAQRRLLKGDDSGEVELADRQWGWYQTNTETVLPNFYRLEIRVSELAADTQSSADAEEGTALYTLVAYMTAS